MGGPHSDRIGARARLRGKCSDIIESSNSQRGEARPKPSSEKGFPSPSGTPFPLSRRAARSHNLKAAPSQRVGNHGSEDFTSVAAEVGFAQRTKGQPLRMQRVRESTVFPLGEAQSISLVPFHKGTEFFLNIPTKKLEKGNKNNSTRAHAGGFAYT